MGDKITVKVDLHGLEEDLLAAGPKIAKRLLRKALKAVGELWKQDIKGRVKVDTGALRDSIDYKITMSAKEDRGTVIIGPSMDTKAMKKDTDASQSPGVYGMWVELGVHSKPDYPVQPFMRPSFDAHAEDFINIFAENLREDLEDAIK